MLFSLINQPRVSHVRFLFSIWSNRMLTGSEWSYSFFMLLYYIIFRLGWCSHKYETRLYYLQGDAVAKSKGPLNNTLEVHLVNDIGYLVTQFVVDLDHGVKLILQWFVLLLLLFCSITPFRILHWRLFYCIYVVVSYKGAEWSMQKRRLYMDCTFLDSCSWRGLIFPKFGILTLLTGL